LKSFCSEQQEVHYQQRKERRFEFLVILANFQKYEELEKYIRQIK